MPRFDVIDEGWIVRRDRSEGAGRAGGARCVVTRGGQVICVFIASSGMGRNDFKPMLTRSDDGGATWSEAVPLWPHLTDDWSILAPIAGGPDGELLVFGSRCRIDSPGELFWNEATQGLKANELIWSRSIDQGGTWLDPQVIPMPTPDPPGPPGSPGAAEAPNPMCVTRQGRYVACYSPYGTFDPDLVVDRSVFVVVYSDDRGATWRHGRMMRFAEPNSGTAMGAVAQLADGRIIGSGWHMHLQDERDHPTPYAISADGEHWQAHRSTGIMGQSVSLTPLPDGGVLMPYNQRRHGQPGVWMALARPTATDFGVAADSIVWQAPTATRTGTSGDHSQWTDFAFGSPAVALLGDDKLLVTFWVELPASQGVRYVRLKLIR